MTPRARETDAGALRIALVCDSYLPRIGGIEVHLDGLARQLARAGHEVDVLTAGATPGAALSRSAEGVRVRRLAIPLLPRAGLAYTPGAVGALRAALVEGAYDVVHCHGSVVSPLAVAGAYLCHMHGTPCVVTHHSVLPAPAILAALDWISGWSRWSVVHTAVSPLVARQLRRAARGRPVHVLPNAVDVEAWAPSPSPPAASETVRVVSVLRLNARKRPLALVRVAAQVAERLRAVAPTRRVVFRIIGDGPQRPAVERLVRRLRLQHTVELLGWQSHAQVRAVFAESDLFVLPSVLESFGIAALEARCAGLPVVARRESGVAAFVRHGREGLLASSDADMVGQVVRLATDHTLSPAITRHNRQTSPGESWAAALARHLAVYRLALSSPRARGTGCVGGHDPARAHQARAYPTQARLM